MVSFKKIGQELDKNGNIIVWTIHKIDGVEVVSRYPKIDGHYVWATIYTKQNFKDCPDAQAVKDYINKDIGEYSKKLVRDEFNKASGKKLDEIRAEYNSVANSAFVDEMLKDFTDEDEISIDSVVEKIDSDNDGVLDTELTIQPDGVMTSKAVKIDDKKIG